jgi:predicted DNA-binding antitoxin AbrB/MazE fold protein
MIQVVRGVYENGILRPLSPLNVPENQSVEIQVSWEDSKKEAEEVMQLMVQAGLMQPQEKRTPPPNPLSEQERQQLADEIGRIPGKPLSEIIIEERGEL